MALTTDPFDSAELAAFISETWTPMVMEEYFAKPVAADFFRDLSEFATAGSDIFHRGMWRLWATISGKHRKLRETLT